MLRNLGFSAVPLHGQMTQPKRLGALNKFKAGTHTILIATEPVPTSHLVGGFEWMHAASGRGHLGEYDPATGEVVP